MGGPTTPVFLDNSAYHGFGDGVIFEINPRFSGGIPLTIQAGADMPRMLVDLTAGRRVAPSIGRFRDDLWIDTWGSPMSDVAKMTERFTRPNFGTLEIELTIDDPKNYTQPFTVKLMQDFEADTELVDEFCLENENSYERMIRSRGK